MRDKPLSPTPEPPRSAPEFRALAYRHPGRPVVVETREWVATIAIARGPRHWAHLPCWRASLASAKLPLRKLSDETRRQMRDDLCALLRGAGRREVQRFERDTHGLVLVRLLTAEETSGLDRDWLTATAPENRPGPLPLPSPRAWSRWLAAGAAVARYFKGLLPWAKAARP